MAVRFAPPASPTDAPDTRALTRVRFTSVQWCALVVLVGALVGCAMAVQLQRHGYAVPDRGSLDIFFRLYALHELPFFAILAVFAAATVVFARGGPVGAVRAESPSAASGLARRPGPLALGAVAVAVTLVAWIGSHLVLHDLPFAMDEFNAVFQARLFAGGHVTARLPATWDRFAAGLTPVFVSYYPRLHAWRSGYLPVYSLIRAAFLRLGIDNATNPILGGLTLVAIAAVARRLWPTNARRQWLAVIFLATSSQFLLMSMGWYSMPAHLLLNMVWLWLYLRDDMPSLILLPVVGVLALGLHNPFPHALFAAPFLIRMAWRRRDAWLVYVGAVYAAGCVGWYAWLRTSYAYQQATGGLLSTFALPGSWQLRIQALQLSLILSWQAPLVVVLALLAMWRWRRLGVVERDLAAGLLLTAAFHFLFPLTQGHGWGYRYIYSALGNLMLLAAVGGDVAAEQIGTRRVAALVIASTVVALVLQWPLRSLQAERFVRPFARAVQYEHALPAAAVVVFDDSSYYGRDLVRNDPYLRGSPQIVSYDALRDSGVVRLRAAFPGRVVILQPRALAALGVPVF